MSYRVQKFRCALSNFIPDSFQRIVINYHFLYRFLEIQRTLESITSSLFACTQLGQKLINRRTLIHYFEGVIRFLDEFFFKPGIFSELSFIEFNFFLLLLQLQFKGSVFFHLLSLLLPIILFFELSSLHGLFFLNSAQLLILHPYTLILLHLVPILIGVLLT